MGLLLAWWFFEACYDKKANKSTTKCAGIFNIF